MAYNPTNVGLPVVVLYNDDDRRAGVVIYDHENNTVNVKEHETGIITTSLFLNPIDDPIVPTRPTAVHVRPNPREYPQNALKP